MISLILFQNRDYSGPKYVFRLLRNDEDPKRGLRPKVSYSNKTVLEHLMFGSRQASHYISTSLTYPALKLFIRKHGKDRDVYIRVVKIDLEKVKELNPEVKVINLTKAEERRRHGIRSIGRTERLAKTVQEVLIVRNIPSSAVSLIYSGPKSGCLMDGYYRRRIRQSSTYASSWSEDECFNRPSLQLVPNDQGLNYRPHTLSRPNEDDISYRQHVQ